ncbi:uncharacterized protein LOC62_04G005280 [Vanrija pseudolonga]|uniref:Uncharacterized protein n=1 Tax=Vanrija pseudolonga TaxID=143232 RepID=A0AAF0YDE5_9TREE|nr:hypothetical protein LOC62_04G005280 [Vanrija pseudolonga]
MLDHTAYPEIVDCILCYSSFSTLLVFRLTSKHFRDQANKRLLPHVVLTKFPDKGWGFTLPPSSDLAPGSRVPREPSFVRTLDLANFPPGDDLARFPPGERPTDDTINPLQAGVHTFRRLGNTALASGPSLLWRVHTVVDFIDLSHARPQTSNITVNGVPLPHKQKRRIHLPLDSRRHVIHLKWDAMSTTHLETSVHVFERIEKEGPPWDEGHPYKRLGAVREFVVVLAPTYADDMEWEIPFPSDDTEGTTRPPLMKTAPIFDLVGQLVPALVAGATLTVVGLERVSSRQLGGKAYGLVRPGRDASFTAFEESTKQHWRIMGWSKEQINTAVGALRLADMDEWLLELDDNRADIEGSWPAGYTHYCEGWSGVSSSPVGSCAQCAPPVPRNAEQASR